MNTQDRMIDEMRDDHMIFITKLQPARCLTAARQYARQLQESSLIAMTAGCLEDACWFAERAYAFNCRLFGLHDTQSRASLKALKAVADYQQTVVNSKSSGVLFCEA